MALRFFFMGVISVFLEEYETVIFVQKWGKKYRFGQKHPDFRPKVG